MQVSVRALREIPKADLHSHIDGSIPPDALFRIARRHGRKLLTPAGAELESVSAFRRFVKGEGYDSMLESIVDRFFPITGVMQTEETIREAAVAYVETQRGDGVAYAEGRFAPQYHTREGMSLVEVIRSMAEGLEEGEERYGVSTSLIVAIGRESNPGQGEEVARAAVRSGKACALDLGGPEVGNPPGKFAKAFKVASGAGLKLTVHAGEGAGSVAQNLANIEEAISRLGADRIGHAIDLSRSQEMMSLVLRRGVGVELNPVSNLVLRKVSDLKELGVDTLLKRGVAASLNSDDPALWPRGNLSNVFYEVCKAYGFGLGEVDALVENSFRSAFLGEKVKDQFIDDFRTAIRKWD